MSVSDYWHLQKLDGTGHSRRRQLDAAYHWLQQRTPNWVETRDEDVPRLQAQLLDNWQQGQIAIALLCLRCLVSHAILRACLQLVSQFGESYQFDITDLLPFVLDDDGKALGPYQPLGVHIVETYTPGKASLEGWAGHLTRNHNALNQFLIEQGLYRVSDWAILNDIRAAQLPKILGEFHRLTALEIDAARVLLERYHGVYRRDRATPLQKDDHLQPAKGRKRGRCQVPSDRQLQAIDPKTPPRIVLSQLRQLAYWLRQYRIHVRGGAPQVASLDSDNGWELTVPERSESEIQQDEFLQTYRQQFETALAEAMTATLQAYYEKFHCKQPAKADGFLKALHLFHCEGEGMKAIAPQVGLTSQVQVTRLMNLKRFRADVRSELLTRLQSRLPDTVLAFTSAEQLAVVGDQLDNLLAEESDRLMAAAESEAQIPHNRTAKSCFAQQLCASLHQMNLGEPTPLAPLRSPNRLRQCKGRGSELPPLPRRD